MKNGIGEKGDEEPRKQEGAKDAKKLRTVTKLQRLRAYVHREC